MRLHHFLFLTAFASTALGADIPYNSATISGLGSVRATFAP